MTLLFTLANSYILPIWASMILAPRSRWTARLLASPWWVLPLIAAYAALILPNLAHVLPVVARPELPAVAQLLGSPVGAAVGWFHFLAFDLLVGRFILLDARERDIPTLVLSLVLIVTLLLAPIGLGAYLAVRARLFQRGLGLLKKALRLSVGGSPMLTWLGVGSLLTAAATIGLMLVDPRQLAGASVWLKPTKFGVSISIAAFTLAFLLRAIDLPDRVRRLSVVAITTGLWIELVVISVQAGRGIASHFNAATPLDGALFTLMGAAIVVVTAAFATIAVYAFRTRFHDPAVGAGIRSGFALMVLGSMLAFLMTGPNTRQLESARRGEPLTTIGGHSVGAADSDAGMPVTRWSDTGGDLRIPHFIGLHALQIMPVVGWALGRRRRANPRLAQQLTRIAAGGYLGLILVTLQQALRGIPLLVVDPFTGALAAGVVASCAAAAFAVARNAQSASMSASSHSRDQIEQLGQRTDFVI